MSGLTNLKMNGAMIPVPMNLATREFLINLLQNASNSCQRAIHQRPKIPLRSNIPLRLIPLRPGKSPPTRGQVSSLRNTKTTIMRTGLLNRHIPVTKFLKYPPPGANYGYWKLHIRSDSLKDLEQNEIEWYSITSDWL